MRGSNQLKRVCATDIIGPTAPKRRRRRYQTTMQKMEILVGTCAIRQDVMSTYYGQGAHGWRRILLGGAWCFQNNCCSFYLTHEIMYKLLMRQITVSWHVTTDLEVLSIEIPSWNIPGAKIWWFLQDSWKICVLLQQFDTSDISQI